MNIDELIIKQEALELEIENLIPEINVEGISASLRDGSLYLRIESGTSAISKKLTKEDIAELHKFFSFFQ